MMYAARAVPVTPPTDPVAEAATFARQMEILRANMGDVIDSIHSKLAKAMDSADVLTRDQGFAEKHTKTFQ